MLAPFAGSELDTFQAMHSGLHQEQIQNAYALTPQMNPNLYGHATPNVVYEDHNAMVMMVEEPVMTMMTAVMTAVAMTTLRLSTFIAFAPGDGSQQ